MICYLHAVEPITGLTSLWMPPELIYICFYHSTLVSVHTPGKERLENIA